MFAAWVLTWLQFCSFLINSLRSIKSFCLTLVSEGALWVASACNSGDVILYNDLGASEDFVYTVIFALLLFASLAFVLGFLTGRWVTLAQWRRVQETARGPQRGQELIRQAVTHRTTTPPTRVLRRHLTDAVSPARHISNLLDLAAHNNEFPVPLASPRASPKAKGL